MGGVTTAFLLDGGNVAAEAQNGTVTETYTRGANLIRRESSAATEYYLYNAHGDVVNLIDTDGAVSQSYDYDAFGVERNPDPQDTNHFRYCGEYLDAETGSYYLRARYYIPEIGRFTQQDTHWNTANMIYGDNPQKINEREDKLGLRSYSYVPQIRAILQSGNLYVYSINDPVNYVDPTGNIADPGSLVFLGIASLLGVSVSYLIPLLIEMVEYVGARLTDLYRMTKKQLEELVERAPGSVAVAAAGMPDPDDDNKSPKEIRFDNQQLGEKYGKHKYDYPDLKTHHDYIDYAKKIFNSPEKIIYDAVNNEYYYILGNDLLRVSATGDFISLYPGASSPRVVEAMINGVIIYGS